MNNVNEIDQSYVPAHLAIEAMRDNGYKNTAYAVAELIDNSIQANANYVQIMCKEKDMLVNNRTLPRLHELAVLDNGDGMNSDVLQLCLQFGNGTRLEKSKRTGIGRFGMGLPASSISQCVRVDVWSWQDGIENALHTYLDIEEVKSRKSNDIPVPNKQSIPSLWLEKGVHFGQTGTLVVWSNLDRFMWSKGQTLINHSELVIGRMYRKFLYDDRIKIDFTTFNENRPSDAPTHHFALPNDPLYLMEKTSCPEPYHETAMFEPYMGIEGYEKRFDVMYNGESHPLYVRFSHAKDEVREGSAGSKPYGKHANGNLGISILRAERELDMDTTLVNHYDPTERWWGIEVEFPPALDELMGVSNNKQAARNFSDVLSMMDDIKKEQEKGSTLLDIVNRYVEEGDPRAPLIEICEFINRQLINQLRTIIKGQNKGSRATVNSKTNEKVEQKAKEVTDIRKEQGHVGQSDEDENKPAQQREDEITETLIQSGVDDESAQRVAIHSVQHNSKYNFIDNAFEGNSFFTVRTRGGAINVIINKSHPAYENLLEVFKEDTDEASVAQLKNRLDKAAIGLKLLLAAWARYEDETPDGIRRDLIQEVREDWGKYAKQFLRS